MNVSVWPFCQISIAHGRAMHRNVRPMTVKDELIAIPYSTKDDVSKQMTHHL